MKRSIVIGTILIVIGSLYCWWWIQPIKQLADLPTQSQVPQNWVELREKYPQLCIAFRLLKMDPFDDTVENSSQTALDMSMKINGFSSRHALAGLLVSIIGITVPAVTAIRKRKKRKS
jgi:hypothetical protein